MKNNTLLHKSKKKNSAKNKNKKGQLKEADKITFGFVLLKIFSKLSHGTIAYKTKTLVSSF